MITMIDLSSIHKRFTPKANLTAIEESRRLERREFWEGLCFSVLIFFGGSLVAAGVLWITLLCL